MTTSRHSTERTNADLTLSVPALPMMRRTSPVVPPGRSEGPVYSLVRTSPVTPPLRGRAARLQSRHPDLQRGGGASILFRRLDSAGTPRWTAEVVFVDDGSRDGGGILRRKGQG